MSNNGNSMNGETPQALPRQEGQSSSNGDKSHSKPEEEKIIYGKIRRNTGNSSNGDKSPPKLEEEQEEKIVYGKIRPDNENSSNGDKSTSKPEEKEEEKIIYGKMKPDNANSSNGDKAPSKVEEEQEEKIVNGKIRTDNEKSSNEDKFTSKPEKKEEKKIIYGKIRPDNEKYEEWDCAIESPPISSDESNECWNILTKICVALLCGALFLVVLVSTGLTRILIHLMIWKLNPPQINYNNNNSTLNRLGGLLQPEENCFNLEYFPPAWRSHYNDFCTLLEDTPSVNVRWIWGLVIAIVVPDIYTFVHSLWRVCFKETERFDCGMFILSFFVELFHTTGLCLLVFLVLPTFDPISASVFANLVISVPVMLSVVCKFKFSPIISFKGITRGVKVANGPTKTNMSTEEENKTEGNKVIDTAYKITQIIGLLFLIFSFSFACVYIYEKSNDEKILTVILFVLSLVFVSFTFWENFLPLNSETEPSGHGEGLINSANDSCTTRLKHLLANYIHSKREKVSLILSIIKVAQTIGFPYAIFAARAGSDSSALDVVKAISFLGSANVSTLTGEINLQSGSYSSYGCTGNDLYLLFVTCNFLGFISFKSARFACRVYRQRLCFALPLMLSMLGTPFFLIPVLKYPLDWTAQDCNIVQPLWKLEGTSTEEIWLLIASGCTGFVSCYLLTLYIWTNNGSKLVKCDRLFRKPPYSGLFLELSLLLTRCKNTSEQTAEEIKEEAVQSTTLVDDESCYYYPFVYFCATMWHETETEMTQLLKSIFKVDYDQFLQKKHQEKIQKKKKGYINEDIYEFEVHIFFDDAFKPRRGKKGKFRNGRDVNEYVNTLEMVVPDTAKSVYGGYELDKVKRYETPYGCRFEWELLTSQKLVVHLKDKTKIRHRKRWSQVMYMYYLLSFKMNELKEKMINNDSLTKHMKRFAENTFVLALDGDVDFNPEAVARLIDRMKKDPLVGAACGRIHPIGSGPMVWYQKFEYALSHWLQKAAEHIFGCVLCSPGCFSLFRGSALLADNVMKTYTRMPTEAVHHVQYDQGEDRWLCTLLLKQKYRVEYCAASDAMTFAPEGFYEFYNQRRRWAPSTMANILDLLLDGNNVRRVNQNISRPYIFYHICLFISSILTPGTIFLLILGAITTAFPEIEPWLALLLNGLPVTIFIISIYAAKEETQLLFAAIFSTLYSLVMIVVLIGLLKEGIESQFCSVTTVFFCFVAGVFVIAAFLHPKEFNCILHGFLYFLAVPSMSMLLVFYSVGNMHNVNWGTRESKTANNDESTSRKVQKRFEGQSCSLGDWCRCILCVNENEDSDPANSTGKRNIGQDNQGGNVDNKDEEHESKPKAAQGQEKESETEKSVIAKTDPKVTERKGQIGTQKRGIFKECEPISKEEEEFWKSLIKKYLKPIEMNDESKTKMHKELIDLRNKVFFFYFITNAIFVTIVYVLTQVNAYQKSLQIPLPCSVGEIQGKIEPISIAFTLVFGILLIIQFFGMLMHRVSTISHIIATTKLIGRKLDTTKIPLTKFEKPTALQEKEDEKPNRAARRGWKVVQAGVGLRSLSGEYKRKLQTITNLKNSIKELPTITEDNEENSELNKTLRLYPDTAITTMSIRDIQRSPTVNTDPCSSNG